MWNAPTRYRGVRLAVKAKTMIIIGVSAFKIGSGELNNFPLLDYICKFKKPMIVSTGMQSIIGEKQDKKTDRIINISIATALILSLIILSIFV